MLTALVSAFILSLLFAPTLGSEGIPTILQQVRIGDAQLVPNTGMSPPPADCFWFIPRPG